MISADQGSPLKQRSFLLFLLTRSFSRFSSQVAAVAMGWQIYDLTGSAFDLGMVGLVQFLPTALLVFVAGHAADRYQRKRVVQICQLARSLTALFLAWGAYSGSLNASNQPRRTRQRSPRFRTGQACRRRCSAAWARSRYCG
jgi:MFS family permease